MLTDKYFDDIRPYRDNEVNDVIKKITGEKDFLKLLSFLFPNVELDAFINKLLTINSIKAFQSNYIYPYIQNVIANSTEGVTISGIENIDKNNNYVFISNHRDIVLDSAFLNILLMSKGFETTEIAIGDNLLIYPWITQLVKLNKSFVVRRNLPARELLISSQKMSDYIRYNITDRKQSVWIAQREGRSKDGNDVTQPSLLKMLNMSGTSNFVDSFKQLNIVPVAISYEYDPCDYLKANEFLQKKINPEFKKTQQDDLNSMAVGIQGRKGRVHFEIGKPINEELNVLKDLPKNEQLNELSALIDNQIHNNYKLWPGNLIAFDIQSNSNKFEDKYTVEDVKTMDKYLNEHIQLLNDKHNEKFIYDTLIDMYANPVKNNLKK